MKRADQDFGEIGKAAGAYERLRQLITEGRLRPSERLIPTRLAALLHISATPIREALARLAAEGYISWRTHLGYFTKPLTVEEQKNLYSLLRILQRGSLEMHIGNFSASGLQTPADPATASVVSPELVEAHVRYLEQLHDRIASLGRNRDLRQVVSIIVHRTHPVRVIAFESGASLHEMRADLFSMIGALSRHDFNLAVAALDSLLMRKVERLPDLVEKANVRALQARLP